LARDPLNVELVIGDTTEGAFDALGPRTPDLVLTSQLLSPKDETALAERLRELDAAGAHVQTLVIPVLGSPEGGKKRGGIFRRLRRASAESADTNEGCDPAVFGGQIAEYLDRAAAERAALAAAQADLEAAWAEDPPAPAVPPSVEPPPAAASGDTAVAANDTDLVGAGHAAADDSLDPNSPEALFGEFAAIPIPKVAAQEETRPDPRLAPAAEDDLFVPVVHVEPTSLVSQMRLEPADEEWEEIAIEPAADAAAHPHTDLHAESVDLDAFVRELETVPTSADAQPMIPVVDLTSAAPIAPSEAVQLTPVSELEARQDAAFDELAGVRHNEETISAILDAPAPALDLGDELDRAVPRDEELAAAFGLPVAEAPPQPDAFDLDASIFATTEEPTLRPADTSGADAGFPAAQLPTVFDTLDQAWIAEQAEANARMREAEDAARAAAFAEEASRLEAALAEAAAAARPAAARPADLDPAAPRPAVHDLLSAIQRDIKVRQADETTPAPAARPEIDLTREPLVFKTRPTVTADVIAEAQSLKPKRAVPAPAADAPLASEVAQNLDASLRASLSSGLAVSPAPQSTQGPEVTELQASLEQQLVKAIEKADTFEAVPEQIAEAPLPQVPPVLDLAALATAATPEASTAEDGATPPPAAPAEDEATPAADDPLAHFAVAAETVAPDAVDPDNVLLGAGADPFAEQAPPSEVWASDVESSDPVHVFQAEAEAEAPLELPEPVPAEPIAAAAAVAVPAPERSERSRDDRKTSKSRRKRRQERQRERPASDARAARPAAAGTSIDDWGFFDPHHAGFASFAAKLNEMSRLAQDAAMPRR
ncbi:MAG: hypothetical protein AB7O32_21060, partial [Vicinamibacterales bacterium]